MIFETERLILREMDENDTELLFKVFGDPDNMCYYPYIFDEARVENWIRTNIERYRVFGFGIWGVCLKDNYELIGDCGLTMQNINGFIRPEIGYHIRADLQRKGYAKEAATAVRDWAFAHTPFKVLYSYMREDNIASTKTAESVGMKFFDKYTDDNGYISLVYAIHRE